MHRLEKLVDRIPEMTGADVTRIREEASPELTKAALGRIIGVERVTIFRWENEPDRGIGRTNTLAMLWVQSRIKR